MDYRGSIKLKYKVTTNTTPVIYTEGERVGQLVIVPIPRIELVESEELAETDRGEGGYGSTDTVKESEILNQEITEVNEVSEGVEVKESIEIVNG